LLSYDISSDGLTITFHLRSDVKWHDGTPFTSNDVAYTYNAHLDPKSGSVSTSLISPFLVKVTAPTNTTAIWNLTSATPGAENWAAAWNFLIVPASRKGNEANYGKNPMGTGPFKFNGVNISGSYISYVPNPNYWGGVPYLAELRWSATSDAQAMLAGIQSGQFTWSETDVVLGQAVAQVATFGDAYINLQTNPIGQYDVAMNTTMPRSTM
jgi:peptide/nickel transport system substrate-binding protein